MPRLWLVHDATLARLGPLAGPWDWIYYKTWLSLWLGVSHDVLHLFAGLGLLTGSAWLLRRPPWSWACWSFAITAELLNEAYDLIQTSYITATGNYAASLHDIAMTMFWPTIVVLAFPALARRAADCTDVTRLTVQVVDAPSDNNHKPV